MTLNPTSSMPDWYVKFLEDVQSNLSNGELFMMKLHSNLIIRRIEKAKMPKKIEGKSAQLLMQWIRRKLFWKVQGKKDTLFFSELPGFFDSNVPC